MFTRIIMSQRLVTTHHWLYFLCRRKKSETFRGVRCLMIRNPIYYE
jgi:hypothetical protein